MLDVDIGMARNGFDLRVAFRADGPATALLGPSGAGKSTTLACIAGLLRPRSGEIRWGDEVLFSSSAGTNLPPERRRIGVVFQEGLLFPHLTARRNLLFGRRPGGRIDPATVIDVLEIGSLLDRRPADLSGGERQRVALGRSLLAEPTLLLLDEPLSSLDHGLRERLLRYLVTVRDEFGIPMLYVTHVVSEALVIAQSVVVMDAGRVLAAGPFDAVVADPAAFRVAHALGLENIIVGTVAAHDEPAGFTEISAGGRTLRASPSDRAVGEPCLYRIRADEIVLAREPVSGLSVRNVLAGRVAELVSVADHVLVRVDAGVVLTVELTPHAVRDLGLEPGLEVHCLLKTHSLHEGPGD